MSAVANKYDFNDATPIALATTPQETGRRLETLRATLKARAPDLVRDMFPHARVNGHEARIGDAHGEAGESMCIEMSGEKAGLWTDHATGEGGDLIGLWCINQGYDEKGPGFMLAVADLEQHLGLSNHPPASFGRVAHVAAERAKVPKQPEPFKVDERTHVYTSADGQTVLAQVIRRDMSDGSKRFLQRNAAGEWKSPEVRPLYGLPDIPDAATVVMVEGEKCADYLIAQGYVATSLMGGSGAPLDKSDLEPLRGKRVILWPDNDDTGRGFMRLLGDRLRGMGCEVLSVDVPANVPAKWDAADCEPEAVHGLISAALAVVPKATFQPRNFDGVLPGPRPWAYANILMSKAVTGIAAPPGVGKTTFSIQMALAFSLDLEFGNWKPVPGGGGKAWLYNGEEPIEELDRRFIASCYEMDVDTALAAKRFSYNSGLDERLTFVRQDPQSGELVRSPHVDTIKQIIRDHGFKLFVIDPLIEFHGAKEDTEGFHALGAILREIANDCDCAVMFFHHTPKAANSDTAAGDMNSMRGGGPIVGVARFVATMFGMSKKDATEYGLAPADRNRFVRFDDAKANMTLVDGAPQWWRKEGVDIGNATNIRAADNIGILRFADLGKPDEEAGRRRVASADVTLAKIAEEMARVCRANGHITADRSATFDGIIRGLDREQTGVSPTTAKDMVTSKMGGAMKVAGGRIVIATTERGKSTLRRVHFEEAAQ